jgi:hypothetical protein
MENSSVIPATAAGGVAAAEWGPSANGQCQKAEDQQDYRHEHCDGQVRNARRLASPADLAARSVARLDLVVA